MSVDRLPQRLREILPPDTARAWVMLRDAIPKTAVLYGGTAIAARLFHRVSRDLDFFFETDIDLDRLLADLSSLRPTAIQTHTHDTLNVVFGQTKVQFLKAAEQTPLQPDDLIAGLRVASLPDLSATKVKVIGDRGELRDYFDLMTIEHQGGITIEQALVHYRNRYDDTLNLPHIVRALGYLGDVVDDPGLPMHRDVIEQFWHRRQAAVATHLSQILPGRTTHIGGLDTPPVPPPPRGAGSPDAASEKVWVEPYQRNGRTVNGHWRRR
ncbi:hypothetical protein BH23ACT9_BH23ACT9_00470 [soil metagenome]